MRTRLVIAAVLFSVGFTIGALLGRRWIGNLADSILSIVTMLTILLLVGAVVSFVWGHARSVITHHLTLSRQESKVDLRLENLGRVQFIELILSMPPSWFPEHSRDMGTVPGGRLFPLTTMLMVGLTIGALLGRSWRGAFADNTLSVAALATVLLTAVVLLSALSNLAHSVERAPAQTELAVATEAREPHAPIMRRRGALIILLIVGLLSALSKIARGSELAPAQGELAIAAETEEFRAPVTRRRSSLIILLILGLLLGALGQAILSSARDIAAAGVAAYTAAIAVLLILARLARRGQQLARIEALVSKLLDRINRRLRIHTALLLGAAGCSWIALNVSQSARPSAEYWFAFYAWLTALLILSVSFIFLPARSRMQSLGEIIKSARIELLVLVALTVLAFILRVLDVVNTPYPFSGDEGSIGTEGVHILNGQTTNMFVTGWSSEPTMSFLPWAISMAIFGQSIFGLRILAVALGALSIPVLYLLVRSMFDKTMAMTSAALLTVMAIHIHFSRLSVNNVENPLLATLVFWLAFRAIKTRQVYWFAATGMAAGVTINSYAGSRLVIILVGAFLLYAFAMDRTLWKEWPKFVLLGLVAGIVALPIGYYFWQHPDIAGARWNQVGAFGTGWVDREVQQTGTSIVEVVGKQVSFSFLYFVSTPTNSPFWNSPGPMYDGLWSLFLILGLFFSLCSIRALRHVWLQLWFWSVIVFGSALIVPPPAASRLVMAFPVVAVFVAWGTYNVASLLVEILGLRVRIAQGLMAGAVVALAVSSLNFYFFDYIPKHYFADVNSEVGMRLGEYLATVPRDSRVYFMGEPRMFYGFPSIPFLSNELDGVDVRSGIDVKQLVEPGRKAIFVALPERQGELEQIQQLYPGGKYWHVPRPTKPEEILYLAYAVQP